MKRIAVFCDGTWNSADQTDPTNVRRMALMVPQRGTDGVEQLALYFQGVGVSDSSSWLERISERISGGAMGWGLDDKIAVAYRYLVRHYVPGDEVFIFGFSRGAYTARSLVGLIRNCGLPPVADDAVLRDSFAHYRDRSPDTHPDSPASLAYRLRVSPGITTSDKEAAFRQAGGHPAGVAFRVAFLGIWDTVGALGIPAHWGLPASVLNRKYRFHDTDLSSMVRSARHAVAIDEERRHFVPALWRNLDAVRASNRAGEYRQEWFAGVHGAVGGGGDVTALSSIALLWIAAGAMRQGLGLQAAALAVVRAQADLRGPLEAQSTPKSLWSKVLSLAAGTREGVAGVGDVAHPAQARWQVLDYPAAWGGRPYRPRTLRGVERELARVDVAGLADYTAVA